MDDFVEHLTWPDSAAELRIVGLHADVLVRTHEIDVQGVRVSTDTMGAVRLAARSGVVTLQGARIRAAPLEPVQIRIDVSPRCNVTLKGVSGSATIDDLDAHLGLYLDGAASVAAGRVESADIRLKGHGGRVAVAGVEGRALGVTVIGAGRVRAAGAVDRLYARVVGSGNVDFGGTAEVADLVIEGSGHVNVLRVTRHLRRMCTGSGDARVAHPPRVGVDAPVDGREPLSVSHASA